MMDESVAQGAQETKRANISGFTEGQRKADLDRIVAKMAGDGWSLKEYNDAGLSASYAIFTRPFVAGRKPEGKSKVWPVLAVIAAVVLAISLFGGGKTDQHGQGKPATSASIADVMSKDLKAYKALTQADRAKVVGKFMADNNLPADQQTNFYNYVSESAVEKSDSVMLQAVLSNAQAEYSTTGGKWHRPHYNLDNFERQFSAWDGSHRELERTIKKSLNDEDSYKHIETKYRLVLKGEGAPYVQLFTSISAKNGFGAMIKKTVGAKATLDGSIVQIDKF